MFIEMTTVYVVERRSVSKSKGGFDEGVAYPEYVLTQKCYPFAGS